MTTYTCTITATFDADDIEEAMTEWADRLTCTPFVEDCTLVTTDDDPANPDTIWHSLTIAAKRSWITAMMPEPEPVLRRPDEATVALIVGTYIDAVRGNDSPTWPAVRNVLDAIERCETWEITMEMWEAAPDGTIPADLSDDEADVWTDALEAALPTIKTALERTSR